MQQIQEIVKKHAEEAGVQDVLGKTADGKKFHKVTPHALRHTFATHLLNEGMRVEHVKKLMGHKKLKTTLGYAKVDEKNAFDSYRKIL